MRDDLLQSRSYVWDCVRQLRQTDFESLLDSTDEVHGLSFEAAVQPLTQLIALFDDLSPERIERLPAEPIELLAQASSALLKCLEEIRHFSYEEENANEKQLSLIERISGIGLEFTEIFRLIDLDRTPEPEIESRPAGAPLPQTSLFLAEQINLNDMEITRRRELLGISEADIDLLGRVRGIVVEEVDRIVEEFYIKQTSIEEVAVVIGDRDTLERLKNAQRQYVVDLFRGCFEQTYVNNRLRIGMVHKRIGVEPKLYLSAVKMLKDTIGQVLATRIDDSDELSTILDILDKVIYFDTQLVFDAYIRSLVSEVESSKEQAVRYATGLEVKVAERTRELLRQSRTDFLTGLSNKRAFIEDARLERERSLRMKLPMVLAFIDIDGFKQINDKFGHARGDEVLRRLARIISSTKREIDHAARFGGDEFCLLLPNTTAEGAETQMRRMRSHVEAALDVGISIGLVEAPIEDCPIIEDLLELADHRMYEVKAIRKNEKKAGMKGRKPIGT